MPPFIKAPPYLGILHALPVGLATRAAWGDHLKRKSDKVIPVGLAQCKHGVKGGVLGIDLHASIQQQPACGNIVGRFMLNGMALYLSCGS